MSDSFNPADPFAELARGFAYLARVDRRRRLKRGVRAVVLRLGTLGAVLLAAKALSTAAR